MKDERSINPAEAAAAAALVEAAVVLVAAAVVVLAVVLVLALVVLVLALVVLLEALLAVLRLLGHLLSEAILEAMERLLGMVMVTAETAMAIPELQLKI